jgi:hypothetical protein
MAILVDRQEHHCDLLSTICVVERVALAFMPLAVTSSSRASI